MRLQKLTTKPKMTIFGPVRMQSLAYLLIILVLYQVGAAWTIYSAAIWIHKKNKEFRLSDTSRWETFSLSQTEYEALLIEEDEIEMNGKLYDIVTRKQCANRIEIVVVADQAENKMKRTLKALQNEGTGWSELTKRAQAFGMSVFSPEKSLNVDIRPFVINTVSYFTYSEDNFQKGVLGVLEQPPAA